MKTCTKCGEDKSLDQFYKSFGRCKKCVAIERKAHYANNRESILQYKKQFHVDNKEKRSAYNRAYREENRDALVAYGREWRKENMAAWREQNKEKINAKSREQRKTDAYRAKSVIQTQSRRASKYRAATKWDAELDAFVIFEAAALAKIREKLVGGKWHVDHVVPLRNESVCGLHNAYNLAVIPAIANLRKSNRIKMLTGSGI